ncbi:MAG TPA: two-component system response regulator [Verrucomicrobiales bacterium]|nr:two-component system response regulator [Verrucomicrobiales bacterium]
MKQRLLIVDDEPQIRELLGMFLEQKGFEIYRAGTAQECLDRVKASHPDLVVLDINLAGEDGLEVLVQIKELRPITKVVMLTGMGFLEDLLKEALNKGADGYVSKVLPMDELLAAIRRILPAA